MLYTLYILSVLFSSKCSLFHNSNVFGSCIIHILYTGCAKILKNNSGAKRLRKWVEHFYIFLYTLKEHRAIHYQLCALPTQVTKLPPFANAVPTLILSLNDLQCKSLFYRGTRRSEREEE
jgi:hypothetical protein